MGGTYLANPYRIQVASFAQQERVLVSTRSLQYGSAPTRRISWHASSHHATAP